MSPLIIITIIVSIMFATATYSIAKQQGANPLGWTMGAFLVWPILAFVVASKFRKKPMLVWAIVADLALVASLVYVLGGMQTASLEQRSADNLKELGHAMIEYADAHDGVAPKWIDDLRPYLTRKASGSNLPPALVSPYLKDPNVVGYRIVMQYPVRNTNGDGQIRLEDLPANARIIEDSFAPPSIRIGVYADGSVRSY